MQYTVIAIRSHDTATTSRIRIQRGLHAPNNRVTDTRQHPARGCLHPAPVSGTQAAQDEFDVANDTDDFFVFTDRYERQPELVE